jgi:hypothetical protein
VADESGLYVIGGKGAGGVFSDQVELISPLSGSVTTLPPLPHGVAGAAACSVGDNILVFGGESIDREGVVGGGGSLPFVTSQINLILAMTKMAITA